MRLALLYVALGVYLLWGFDLAAVLTGWAALKLYFGLSMFYAAYYCGRKYWEIRQGLHQWPTAQGRFYDEWMKIPIDKTDSDYYTWLAEKKGWQEPWKTWAKWHSEITKKA